MDVREFDFWVEEARRANASKTLEAISVSCAPHMEQKARERMVRSLQRSAETKEERDARRRESLEQLRRFGAGMKRRPKRKVK